MAAKRGGCCGFDCLRLTLCFINTLYLILALLLIAVVVIAKSTTYYTEPHILIGVLVSGIVLFLIAVLGLVGTIHHHQAVLFIYMVSLSISGIVMFSVSVAALVLSKSQIDTWLGSEWRRLDNDQKSYLQDQLNCCGFSRNVSVAEDKAWGHPLCNTTTLTSPGSCCANHNTTTNSSVECPLCEPCYDAWKDTIVKSLKASGSLGIIFSITQVAGVIAAYFYRNHRDPNVNLANYL